MSLEAADKAIVAQQVKHHHVRFDVDLQYSIHLDSSEDSGWLTLNAKQKNGVTYCTLTVTMSVKFGYLTSMKELSMLQNDIFCFSHNPL